MAQIVKVGKLLLGMFRARVPSGQVLKPDTILAPETEMGEYNG